MLAKRIKAFFTTIQESWDAVPGPVKVFMYATSSAAFGLWLAGDLNWREVAIVVATNIGIYQTPRLIGTGVRKML